MKNFVSKKSVKIISLVLALVLCVCGIFTACSSGSGKLNSISTENVNCKVGEGFYVAYVADSKGVKFGIDYNHMTERDDVNLINYVGETLYDEETTGVSDETASTATDETAEEPTAFASVEEVEKSMKQIEKHFTDENVDYKYLSDGWFLTWNGIQYEVTDDSDEGKEIVLDEAAPADIDDATLAYIMENGSGNGFDFIYFEATAAGTTTLTIGDKVVNVTIFE